MEHQMKINPAKLAILLLLVVSSICSYIYLNTYQALDAKVVEEVQEQPLEEEAPREEVFLPDVGLIKKIVSGAQRLIPS